MADKAEHIAIPDDSDGDVWVRLVELLGDNDGCFAKAVADFGPQDVQFASISTSGSGDKTLIASIPEKQIRVLGMCLAVSGSAAISFKSESTLISGAIPLVAGAITGLLSGANGQLCVPYSPVGWLRTTAGEALVMNVGSSANVAGFLTYRVV